MNTARPFANAVHEAPRSTVYILYAPSITVCLWDRLIHEPLLREEEEEEDEEGEANNPGNATRTANEPVAIISAAER